jgi:hypothetical protein
LESYLPTSKPVILAVKSSWMWSVMSVSDLGRPLTCSFAALCLARSGLVLKDKDLIAQGRSQYGQALTSLQRALNDPEIAFQDTTLAAMRTLTIYEVYISTVANYEHQAANMLTDLIANIRCKAYWQSSRGGHDTVVSSCRTDQY